MSLSIQSLQSALEPLVGRWVRPTNAADSIAGVQPQVIVEPGNEDEVAAVLVIGTVHGDVADLARLARGGDAISQTYEDFVTGAKILRAELKDPEIDVIADVAVATFEWRMRYEFQGAEFSEIGHDVYVFGRQGGRWLISWRKVESRPVDKSIPF